MVSYHSAFGDSSPVDQYDFPTKYIPVEHVKNIETATDAMLDGQQCTENQMAWTHQRNGGWQTA